MLCLAPDWGIWQVWPLFEPSKGYATTAARRQAETSHSSPAHTSPPPTPLHGASGRWQRPSLPCAHPLYCPFQVTPCSKRYSHDWASCPYAHPGERAARRDPRKYA